MGGISQTELSSQAPFFRHHRGKSIPEVQYDASMARINETMESRSYQGGPNCSFVQDQTAAWQSNPMTYNELPSMYMPTGSLMN